MIIIISGIMAEISADALVSAGPPVRGAVGEGLGAIGKGSCVVDDPEPRPQRCVQRAVEDLGGGYLPPDLLQHSVEPGRTVADGDRSELGNPDVGDSRR